VYTTSDIATKTKPEGKKGKLIQAKRSGATLKKDLTDFGSQKEEGDEKGAITT
jgi:hypothetical protein